jgi:hypothetical protein
MSDNTDMPLAEIRQTTAVARPNVARPLILAEVLTVEAQQRQLLGQYVKHHMIDGSDYGTIPGTNKPTLLKAGAEKLVDLFRCTPVYEIVERIEDWDKPLFHYLFRVRIESRESGVVVAEGYGSANSRESRYRWRNGERKCPSCGKPAIIRGKAEYGGGWICFKKKDGCNAKFRDGDQVIESQQVGRVENPDICDQANTILKMAKKRALVDASIALARCSDLFTQDIEDTGGSDEYTPAENHYDPQPTTTPQVLPPRPNREPGTDELTDKTMAAIEASLRILKREWNADTIALASRAVGHVLPGDITIAELTESEGEKLMAAFNKAMAKKAQAPKGGA